MKKTLAASILFMVLGVSSVFAQTATKKPKIYLYKIQVANTVTPVENRIRLYLQEKQKEVSKACIDIKSEGINGLGLADGRIFITEGASHFLTNEPLSEKVKAGMAQYICETELTTVQDGKKNYSTENCKVSFSETSDLLSDIKLVIEPASSSEHDHGKPSPTNEYSFKNQKTFPKFSYSCVKNIIGHDNNLTTPESVQLLEKFDVDLNDIETISLKGKNIYSYLFGFRY